MLFAQGQNSKPPSSDARCTSRGGVLLGRCSASRTCTRSNSALVKMAGTSILTTPKAFPAPDFGARLYAYVPVEYVDVRSHSPDVSRKRPPRIDFPISL